MPSMVIRNLPEWTHQALKARARRHGRSTEAEARAVLGEAVAEEAGQRLGSILTSIRQEVGELDLDGIRDAAPYEPMDL
ncbi:FitA-like ribbon-helix-helix domain-containing protein [Actinomyces trachealis]|uniref:FitA-like ribbon-helix-helix domain-containing protein n=1 Tax=Actinomyces trachealis TaxID=2763540 RepID=UPI001892B9F6|nr:plasmid stability protein [Actinomyces trachealis]